MFTGTKMDPVIYKLPVASGSDCKTIEIYTYIAHGYLYHENLFIKLFLSQAMHIC